MKKLLAFCVLIGSLFSQAAFATCEYVWVCEHGSNHCQYEWICDSDPSPGPGGDCGYDWMCDSDGCEYVWRCN